MKITEEKSLSFNLGYYNPCFPITSILLFFFFKKEIFQKLLPLVGNAPYINGNPIKQI